MHDLYSTLAWRGVRAAAIARDSGRCTVARLLGGDCSDVLHAHHIESVEDRPDLALVLDNVATVCARHHPIWESVRRTVARARSRAALPVTEKERSIRRAEGWIRNGGFLFDREAEVLDFLFGIGSDHELRKHRSDRAVRARLLAYWRDVRAGAAQMPLAA